LPWVAAVPFLPKLRRVIMDDATVELSAIVEQLAALALTAKEFSQKPLFELKQAVDADDSSSDVTRPVEKAVN
jgi:hypothetical protein